MQNLPRFSIKNPVTVSMIVLGVLLLGFISFSRLGTNLMPEIDNPRLFVEINAGERPPSEIEKQLVSPIEALIVRQKGVDNVASRIMAGQAQITISYTWKNDMDQAFLELQKALSPYSARNEVEELRISRFDPNADPVLQIALTDSLNNDMNQLRLLVENQLRPDLVRIEGVAEVVLAGEREMILEVQTNPNQLQAYGISLSQITNTINRYNQTVSGGNIEEKGQRYIVRGSSAINKPSDLGELVIKMVGSDANSNTVGSPVRLKDVASIQRREGKPDNMVGINGETALGLYIYKENRFNTVKMVSSVFTALEAFKDMNTGTKMQVVENQGDFIETSISEVSESALIGIFFAVLVLFLFLRNWGATLVVSIAIPLSIIATFGLMYFNDLTLNLMTLGGLALGAGMLVDNAIVVLENIFRLLEAGRSPKDAAIEGAGGVGSAIIASTITTIIVFLPVVYLQGVSGEFFKDQAWTVAFSLICSLAVALMVIPLLSTKLIGKRKRKERTYNPVFYQNILIKTLNNKGKVLLGALIITAGSYALIPYIGSTFLPQAASDQIELDISLPAGTSLERTHTTLTAMQHSIEQLIPDETLKWSYLHAGPSIAGTAQSFTKGENSGFIKLAFTKGSSVDPGQLVTHLDEMFANIPGIEIQYGQTEPALKSLVGDEKAPFVLEVRGPDMEELESIISNIQSHLSEFPSLMNINTSFEEEAPQVDIRIDRLKAGMLGLDIPNIIGQLQAALQNQQAGSMEQEGNRLNIQVASKKMTLDDLNSINITQGEQRYRLSQLADIVIEKEPKQILRENQSRVGKIYAGISPEKPFDKVVKEVEISLNKINIPPGYQVLITGDEQRRKESFSQLFFALILSIVLVYMVMASQFESLIHPFTILLTIPLAGVGTIFAFWLLGMSFNIMAFIGVVMLGGIAVNDAIILVDAINQYKREGVALRQAVLQAASDRLRPILMTSITTILALLPLALSIGRSASLRSPLAIAVIAGLFTSTLLTLVVIPSVYELLDRSGRKKRSML
jgi:HAE1 family hydrophobic/amphiphilic exporter-1